VSTEKRGTKKTNGAYRHRSIHALYVALIDENFSCPCAKGLHLRLLEVLAPPQLLDLPVKVGGGRSLSHLGRNSRRPTIMVSRNHFASKEEQL
jgi:hypothetical protein